ncbi:MAG: metallophosphoesterase [Chitinophagaceae bacterium]|nr:MAG: metallophosphoesterase [Chitinophagaceae bacterium]
MRRILRYILLKPVLWATQKFSSRPQRDRIFKALDKLYHDTLSRSGKKGLIVPYELNSGKFIIFSDQHKGARDGADDFMMAEPNYLAALAHYEQEGYSFISLGDSEELWENSLLKVKKYNQATFEAEKKFAERDAFVKVIGNHDLYWGNDPFAWWQLKHIYGKEIKIYEGLVLSTEIGAGPFNIFCTHGHQGDAQSDGNWFSKFFVAQIWAPFQAYLRINSNTAAYDDEKKTLHNEIMYEWSSSQKDTLLITGHTHQPVFESLTHIERLYKQFQAAEMNKDREAIASLYAEIRRREKEFTSVAVDYQTMRPSYFNSGCCCFIDGDITGIEISDASIRLIKWTKKDGTPKRELLEEISLEELAKRL